MFGDVVDFRIARHYAKSSCMKGSNPWNQIVLTQAALGELDGAAFHATGRLALCREVGHQRDDLIRRSDVGSLCALDDVSGDLSVEVWVLGIRFHVAAHARIAIQLQNQRGEDVDTN